MPSFHFHKEPQGNSIRADEVEDMPLRNSNPVKGCIIVLQIEHIDLEFNINVFPFSPSRNP
ncbi:MAG TPA: hypothetical protein VLZ10_04170, partial [Thermodesulfobacteriota bacterium]|nr:hypothetical protein [Thermodesulfobacteriota bacterium]